MQLSMSFLCVQMFCLFFYTFWLIFSQTCVRVWRGGCDVCSTFCLSQISSISWIIKKKKSSINTRRTFGKRECKRWYFCNSGSINSQRNWCFFFLFFSFFFFFLFFLREREREKKRKRKHKVHFVMAWEICRKSCKLNVC